MIKLSFLHGCKLLIVGTGGTGGILVQNLAHFVYGLPVGPRESIRIILVDGDVVELRNVGRQKFTIDDVGRNKAERLAVRYSDVFGLNIEYVTKYVQNKEQLLEILLPNEQDRRNNPYSCNPLSILIMAVDNNFSRQVAHRTFIDDRVENLIYIDTGNENGRGQTVVGVKWEGNIIQDPCGMVFPDVLTADDPIRQGGSCGQEAVENPQTLLENVWSATITLSYLINILKDSVILSHYTFFDTTTGMTRVVENERIKEMTLR